MTALERLERRVSSRARRKKGSTTGRGRTLVADEDSADRDAMLVGDLLDLLVLEQRRVGRAERRVGLRDDGLRLEVGDEVVLREVRVELDLQGGSEGGERVIWEGREASTSSSQDAPG